MITDAGRRPGRPRSQECDRAILDAAFELFADDGFEGLTVEGVAARAGVGKATIYRRYPCKVDLVLAAASCLRDSLGPPPDTGRLHDDLRQIAHALVRLLTATPGGRGVRQIVAELDRNPDLRRAHRCFTAERRAGTIAAVERALERGEVRRGTDPELVADLISGPIFYRYLVSGADLDETYADAVVDRVLQAFQRSRNGRSES